MRTRDAALIAGWVVFATAAPAAAAPQDAGARVDAGRGAEAGAVDQAAAPAKAGGPGSGDAANPHGVQHNAGMPGVFDPPDDVETPDPSLPRGTIAVDLRDADDKPVPHELVTLGEIDSSVAKGESRRHFQSETDDRGRAVFSNLNTSSSAAYRVSAGFQGGSFAATPFRLEPTKPMRVVLHVYPVAHDLEQALVVAEFTLAGEVREDRIQFEEVVTFYNLGRTAWQPQDVTLALPAGFKALNSQATMSDQGVDEVEGGAKLRGTFPPGRHPIQFTWQLPWSDTADVNFAVGIPQRSAIARVVMPVAAGIQLGVAGFPPAQVRLDGQGQRFFVAERRLRPDESRAAALDVSIRGLPTLGPSRYVASLISVCGILVGLALSLSRRSRLEPPEDARAARNAVLEELADLERARDAGEVGPKTYDRSRRELIDALARTLG